MGRNEPRARWPGLQFPPIGPQRTIQTNQKPGSDGFDGSVIGGNPAIIYPPGCQDSQR